MRKFLLGLLTSDIDSECNSCAYLMLEEVYLGDHLTFGCTSVHPTKDIGSFIDVHTGSSERKDHLGNQYIVRTSMTACSSSLARTAT